MKKIFFAVVCALSLMSCESNDGIHGTWKRECPAVNGYGYAAFSITYKNNGTYKTTAYVDGLGSVCCDGKYEYVGELLREYDRTEDGQYFEQPRVSRVVIDGSKMYVYPNGSDVPTVFHR